MIFKINFSVSGDNLWPKKINSKIIGDFIIDSYNNPDEKKFEGKDEIYDYGSILFWHPKKFAIDENIAVYENWFVEFIETNYQLFKDNGAEDLELYIEAYYDGGQCNFELFNKVILKRLAQFNVSIPISIYCLSENEFEEWYKEIKLNWQ